MSYFLKHLNNSICANTVVPKSDASKQRINLVKLKDDNSDDQQICSVYRRDPKYITELGNNYPLSPPLLQLFK